MEWTNQQVLTLIEAYRSYPMLWDPKDPDYKNRIKKKNALASIAQTVQRSPGEVERKLHNIKGQFQRERMKLQRYKASGEVEYSQQTKWFAYKHLEFLATSTVPRRTANIMDETQFYRDELQASPADAMFSNSWPEQQIQVSAEEDEEPEAKKVRVSTPDVDVDTAPAGSRDPLDMFFCSMCESTKRLQVDLQLRVKRQLFEAVAQAEEEQQARTLLSRANSVPY
ncbi:uncharacterized protein [Periplaneta americana]|uniref:uncharacterized protein isoform X2 n=1 Tax=Periplaneta americana TaxID=6978 RepID=UPI0037E7939F